MAQQEYLWRLLIAAGAVALIGAANATPAANPDVGAHLKGMLPWLNTATLLTIAGIASRLWLQNRRLRLAENKDDRDGYGALITTLQAAIATMEAKHTADMTTIRAEHTSQIDRIANEHRRCEERLSKIEGELMGFHRQALVASQSGIASLPASMMVRDAGERAVTAATKAHEERIAE